MQGLNPCLLHWHLDSLALSHQESPHNYTEVPKRINQILAYLKEGIDSNTIMVGDFNTLLISMDRSSRQKVNKETVALNKILG